MSLLVTSYPPRLGADHLVPPENTAVILVDNCGQVDLNTGMVNLLPRLTNITITNTNTLTLQPRVNILIDR